MFEGDLTLSQRERIFWGTTETGSYSAGQIDMLQDRIKDKIIKLFQKLKP